MDSSESRRDGGGRAASPPKSKQGVRSRLPGARLSVAVSLMQKHLTQLDLLAVEIRAARGIWITRSGIITAIIEATVRSAPVPELPATAKQTNKG
jgi:hypothetical protein